MSDILSIYIISKSGGLIFNHDLQPSKLTTNEKIVLASMFHSMYAISALEIFPPPKNTNDFFPPTGIETLDAGNFRLDCFQTLTGVKFIIISNQPQSANIQALLRKIYEIYSDYALKNPFYSLDMPIRCEKFEQIIQSTFNNA